MIYESNISSLILSLFLSSLSLSLSLSLSVSLSVIKENCYKQFNYFECNFLGLCFRPRIALGKNRVRHPLIDRTAIFRRNIDCEFLKQLYSRKGRGPATRCGHRRTRCVMSECIMVNHIFAEETRSLSHATLGFLPSSVHCPVDYAEYTYPGSICFSRVSPSKV